MLLNRNFFHKHKKGFTRYKVKCTGEIKRERNLFKSTLIHDMKTPILALIQSMELMKKGSFGYVNETQLEIISQMQEAHNLLLGIIKNFDFLLSCENNDYCFTFEKLELIKEIKSCLGALKKEYENKNLKIIVNAHAELYLTADTRIIQKIIYNLISCCVSLGAEGSVIKINVKESKTKIYFYIHTKSLYMSEEKIESMLSKERDTLCDFNQLGMSFNLNMVRRLINLQNWYFIAKFEGDNVSTFGFVALK